VTLAVVAAANDIEPVAVALKFGFIAVLFLFLIWVTRSSLRDLRGTGVIASEGTGYHDAVDPAPSQDDAVLVVQEGGGLKRGERYDLFGGLSIGRSPDADIRVEDRYASGIHARVFGRGGAYWVEDLNSTNGTLLNAVELHGEAGIDDGDLIRIGDTEFRFERDG
jgi:pSer/pThr/pTyr-binding forkhead associated (FHA) protein